ncbi:MAG: HAMP domain-containing protein, partial [Candidatus Latescibacterota bacterium]
PVKKLVRTIQIGLIIAGVTALFFTILTTRIFLGRYLNRPLGQLVAGARAIGSGDLDQRIQLAGQTELSVLADTINQSRVKLKESIQEISDQRDDLQNLYYIADQLGRSIQPTKSLHRAVELIGSVFESDCLIIAGHFHPESRVFHGTVTYRSDGEILERRISDENDLPAVSFGTRSIVRRWLRNELGHRFRIRDGSTVAFPLERRGRRLGIILAPARSKEDYPDGRATAANPEVVGAFIKHLTVTLELSELQRQMVRQERLAAIGQALAGLAHCLRNTLNGLRGGEYIVETAMRKDDRKKMSEGWRVLKGGVRHIERLTLDMLFYTADRRPNLEPTDPNQVVLQVIDLLRESAAHQGVTFRVDLDDLMEPLPIDKVAMYQVFLNLVSNAVDACVDSASGDLVKIK